MLTFELEVEEFLMTYLYDETIICMTSMKHTGKLKKYFGVHHLEVYKKKNWTLAAYTPPPQHIMQ